MREELRERNVFNQPCPAGWKKVERGEVFFFWLLIILCFYFFQVECELVGERDRETVT